MYGVFVTDAVPVTVAVTVTDVDAVRLPVLDTDGVVEGVRVLVGVAAADLVPDGDSLGDREGEIVPAKCLGAFLAVRSLSDSSAACKACKSL
jgi:hypothetical protein